jgi:ABC-type nickel/cobalt efflux system permease component RcnA
MSFGIALFPAGVWWAQGARESTGQEFDTSDWRVWLGFVSSMVVFATGAWLRWRSQRKAANDEGHAA